jgi:L-rhamnose mutarotase
MDKELLIDATGLLFIKTSTDLDFRIQSILRDSGISKYRIFLKENINNQFNINKRYSVEEDLKNKYNAEVYKDMKLEISNIYYSNKNKYIVATLSGELFALLDGTHFDYYHKRNKYVDLK